MIEKTSLLSKPHYWFAIGFIVNFGWVCGDFFFKYQDKLPSAFNNLIPVITVIILFFTIEPHIQNTKGNGYSSRTKAYSALGGALIGLFCGQVVTQYF